MGPVESSIHGVAVLSLENVIMEVLVLYRNRTPFLTLIETSR